MRLVLVVASLCVFILCSSETHAFSAGGHKVVASIAYRSLTPEQRQRVIAILENHPRFQQDFRSKMPEAIRDGSLEARQEWLFQQAAIWPDLAKDFPTNEKKRFSRSVWHYINRPVFLSPEDEAELHDSIDVNLNVEPPSNDNDFPRMNVIQAIVNSSRILADADQSPQTKAIHLCWLLHTIGDIHQPLHSSALFSQRLFRDGDRGGGDIKTTVNSNLHNVWDMSLGGEISMEEARDRAKALLAREDLQSEAQTAASELSPLAMWDESHGLAVTHAYSREVLVPLRAQEERDEGHEAISLAPEYLSNRKQVCERTAVRAGVRCASYLSALASDHPNESVALSSVRRLDPANLTAGRILQANRGEDSRVEELEKQFRVLNRRVDELARVIDSTRAPFPRTVVSGATPMVRAAASRFPDFDEAFTPPAGNSTFHLSQDYPTTYDPNEQFPWMEIDFRTNGVTYLRSILAYCLEGNIEVEFRGQDNAVRKWYHAPWMHNDSAELSKRAGREFHRGLTSERRSRPQELHPLQTGEGFPGKRIQNWAVSLYSPRGGHTLGRIWRTCDGMPDPYQANFPDNTVTFKLLFTAAPVEQVPFLKGSLEWTANISPLVAQPTFNRVDQNVRLLQVDVAVKDPRVAESTGWIFGTFVYDGSRMGASPFAKLVPVGLSWSDDAHEKGLLSQEGSFINPRLRSTVINHELLEPSAASDWMERAYVRHHGLGGRLNGPVDNPSSSCISCHGRAGTAASRPGYRMPIINKTGSVADQIDAFDSFFRLIRPGTQIVRAQEPTLGETDFVTVDYSLQVSMGIRNFYAARAAGESPLTAAGANLRPSSREVHPLPRVMRGDED